MAISEAKMKIVIDNYFKSECDVNTSIREAFEKGFRIGVQKGMQTRPEPPKEEKLMFKVKYKYDTNPKPEIVYSARKADDGTVEFLMFQYGGWYWCDADSYEPWEDEA